MASLSDSSSRANCTRSYFPSSPLSAVSSTILRAATAAATEGRFRAEELLRARSDAQVCPGFKGMMPHKGTSEARRDEQERELRCLRSCWMRWSVGCKIAKNAGKWGTATSVSTARGLPKPKPYTLNPLIPQASGGSIPSRHQIVL